MVRIVLLVRKYLHIQPSREQKGLVKIRLEGDGEGENNICAFCEKVFVYTAFTRAERSSKGEMERGETTSVLFVRKYLHIQPSREQKGLVKIRLEGDGKGGNNICAFCGKVLACKRAYERVRDVGRVFKEDVSRVD